MKAEELFNVIKEVEKKRQLGVKRIWTDSPEGGGLLLNVSHLTSTGEYSLSSYDIEVDVVWPDATKSYPLKAPVKYEPCRYCGMEMLKGAHIFTHPQSDTCPWSGSIAAPNRWPVVKESCTTETTSKKEGPIRKKHRADCGGCGQCFHIDEMILTKEGLFCSAACESRSKK